MLELLFIPQIKNKFQPILLRKIALFFYSIILLVVNYSPLFAQGDIAKVSASSIIAVNIVNLTNADRERNGLPSLKQNISLSSAANAKANDMFNKQYWDHFGPSGETPWQFIKQSGYEYVYAGENLAKGFQTSEGVEQAWMASPTHRDNLLSPNYQEIGVAVVTGTLKGEYVTLVVQMFGNTTSDVFQINQNTRGVQDQAATTLENTNSNESGSIKSIKFVTPKAGSVLTDPTFNIKGETEILGSADYNVQLKLNNSEISQISSSTPEWVFVSDRDFPEGKNTLSAFVLNQTGISSSVDFSVDSTPPVLTLEMIKFSQSNSNQTRASINMLEKDVLIKIIIDQTESGFVLDETSSAYIAYFDIPNNFQKASVIASDIYGNMTTIDITSRLNMYLIKDAVVDENKKIADEISIGGFFSMFSIKDLINVGIGLFVLSLLLIELNYYKKEGKLHEKFHSIVFVALWVTSVFLTIIGNLSGAIT